MTQTCNPGPEACCAELLTAASLRMFRALSDPNRVSLLARLAGCREGATVTELSSCCPIDLSVVSRHLAALRDAGLVRAERHGRQVTYLLDAAAVAARLRQLADALETGAPERARNRPGTAGAHAEEYRDEGR